MSAEPLKILWFGGEETMRGEREKRKREEKNNHFNFTIGTGQPNMSTSDRLFTSQGIITPVSSL